MIFIELQGGLLRLFKHTFLFGQTTYPGDEHSQDQRGSCYFSIPEKKRVRCSLMLGLPCSRGTPARVLPSLLYSGHGRRFLKHKAHQAPRCGASGLRASQHLAPTAAGSYREKPCRAWGPHRHVCSCVGLLCKQEVRDLWALFMSN